MLRQPILAFGLLASALVFLAPTHPALGEAPLQGHATKAEPGPAEKTKEAHAPSAEPAKAGASHEAEPKQPDITEVQSPLAIWTLVVFVCLLLVLRRFAWKPLVKILDEREAHLEHVLLDTERARNEAETLAAQNRRELAKAADEVRALIEEARKEAQATADSIVRKAQTEAEAARKRAEREIIGARDQALMEIWSSTAELAVSVAGRVLTKELSESDHRRLVEVALGELPANGQQGARA